MLLISSDVSSSPTTLTTRPGADQLPSMAKGYSNRMVGHPVNYSELVGQCVQTFALQLVVLI